MFCGAGSFSHMDEDPGSPPTPRGSRRNHGVNNPYSTTGLDKFSMVLADLESRRAKIMAKAGTQGVSVVRFVHSNSQGWVPIIVMSRDQPPEEEPKKSRGGKAQVKTAAAAARKQPSTPRPAEQAGNSNNEAAPGRAVKKSFSWKQGEREGGGSRPLFRWNPSYYWPTMAVLVLLCLVFGRAFAICCTTLWWYLVPRMKGDQYRNVRRFMKKDYGRRLRDKRLGAGGGDGAEAPAQAKRDGLAPSPPRHHMTCVR